MSGQADTGLGVTSPQYECPECGKALPLARARLVVICDDHDPEAEPLAFTVRDARPDDRRAIEAICDQALGETEVDLFGRAFDVLASENIVAEVDGSLAGLISVASHAGELAVVLFSVYPHFQGREIGSALVEAAAARAAAKGLPALKTAVSNDDLPTLYFLQRHGFAIYDVAIGLLADRLGFAASGFAGMPIRDEMRLRRPVCP